MISLLDVPLATLLFPGVWWTWDDRFPSWCGLGFFFSWQAAKTALGVARLRRAGAWLLIDWKRAAVPAIKNRTGLVTRQETVERGFRPPASDPRR